MAAKALGVAPVTGASQGIGRAIALRLGKDGFKVAVNDIADKSHQLKAVSQEIEQLNGHKTHFVTADVSNEAEVEAMVDTVTKNLGGLDVMVANAGILNSTAKAITEYPAEEWERIFSINTRGVFFCYKYAAKQLITQGRGGRIIGASSIAGKRAAAYHSAYSASKFAVRGLTQSAALELGEHGITVNAYAPGFIKTPMTEAFWDHPNPSSMISQTGYSPSSFYKLGEPEDIARLVSYLASKEAHYITGQTISPNGGLVFD